MSSRRPPPSSAPPPYAFVSRMYSGKNIRPIVLVVTAISAIWALFSAINSFQDLQVEHNDDRPKLATLSAALGALYITVFVIELFGLMSTITQRLFFVRIFAYGSIFAALAMIAAGFLRTIAHFTVKDELISTCADVASGQSATFSLGIWGPTTSETLTPTQALAWCNSAWSRDSFNEIIALILVIILGALFAALTWSYYRQVLDPSSPANSMRAPSNQVRMGAYPSHYSPPYNASVPNLGYNYPSSYAPPAGAPPPRDETFAPPYDSDDSKLPGYGAGMGVGDAKKQSFEQDGKDDPFSDFDGPSGGERDITGRPGRDV